ncbi:MAG: signal peptidase II [Actinomycetales bacterium]|nr:signal peptidase II [Actinomycetales bacterium]
MQGEDRAALSAATPTPPGLVPDDAPARARRPLIALTGSLALLWYAADQVSKAWALRALADGDPVDLVGQRLRLVLVHNPGAAFSLGTGSTWVLTLLAVVVLIVILRSARSLGSRAWAWAFGLLLGGATGNLTDRLVRPPGVGQGHVVDFIDYNGWFIGNVADIAIVSAAILMALLALRGIGVDGRRAPDSTPASDARG